MRYSVIILLICGIKNSSQINLTDNICHIDTRLDQCCHNFEPINGICTECKIGMTTDAKGRCMSCENDMYGYKCIKKCVCGIFHRCDAKEGCVPKISIPMISTTYEERISSKISTYWFEVQGTTETILFSNERVTTTATTVTRNESSMVVWIVLTISSISCGMLTGAGCFICIYRKQQVLKLRIINEGFILEPTPYIGVYDEVDENPLTFAITDLNVLAQEPHYETMDSGSLEKISITTSSYSDTENRDLHVAMEEGTHQQLEDQTECISTNSSNSDVLNPVNTAYHNLYEPLKGNWKDNLPSYEVPVMVHNFKQISAEFDPNAFLNVDKPLQINLDMNISIHENQNSQETKTGNDTMLLG